MPDRLHVATRKGLITAHREGTGWRLGEAAFLGATCTAVHADPRDGTLYLAVGHGHFGAHLHRSVDGGDSWEEIGAPAYPPGDGQAWTDPYGRTIPDTLDTLWCLRSGPASRPGELWAGTIPGGLFRSPDGGESWALNRALWDEPLRRSWFGGGAEYPGIHTVLIDPQADDRLTVAVSCGGVWVSDDAGESWRCHGEGLSADYLPEESADASAMQDPHRIEACRAVPSRVWMQHHNGIYRSDDGGRSWHTVDAHAPSRFGFAVAAHPHEPDTAWFVPAVKDEQRVALGGRLVVTRTRDAGASFEVLDAGLPASGCYDIVYRHALAVDGDGEVLAMGSTTGGLWVSEDAGEHWSGLSAHLPPVYALEFV